MSEQSTFSSIAILGPGLLGGSLALACQERFPDAALRLWGRNEEKLSAVRLGLPKALVTSDLSRAIDGAELIILATPVGSMAELVAQMLELPLAPGTVITDVGSVKAMVHAGIDPLLMGRGVEFIGSHPMAGSERAGFEAARADLFVGSTCILTGAGKALPLLTQFWESLGCRCVQLSPVQHDRDIARISHLPHVLASVGSLVGLADLPPRRCLAGGGFRDTTRVASGDPALWAEILLENREALRQPLEEAADALREVLAILESADQEQLVRWLASAKSLRDLL